MPECTCTFTYKDISMTQHSIKCAYIMAASFSDLTVQKYTKESKGTIPD